MSSLSHRGSHSENARGADILADALIAAGVDVVFGLPGDTGVTFYDALFERREALFHVLTRDERHAVIMADAYARSRNRVGVVEVSSGGGSTYAVGGMGEAFASSIPIVLISSDIHSGSEGTGALTEIDQVALFSAVTKAQMKIDDPSEIWEGVGRAFEIATSGRPGPVVLIIPEDVMDAKGSLPAPSPRLDNAALRMPSHRTGPSEAIVQEVAIALRASERPALVIGSGVHMSDAYSALSEAATRMSVPVATTIHGKGTFDESNPLSLGVVGNNGGRRYAIDYLRDADMVVFVGTRANATDTVSFTAPPREGAHIVRVDVDPVRIRANYPNSTRILGDARMFLSALGDWGRANAASLPDRSDLLVSLRTMREKWQAAEDGRTHELNDGELLPRDLIRIVERFVDSPVVIGDPGTPTPNIASYWTSSRNERAVLIPRGHGPMGWAIPAAVGASFAWPSRRIVSFTTDGSFGMASGELETMARFGLPVLAVQMSNGGFGWIKMLQHLYMGRRYFGVEPGEVDSVAIARASGIEGHRVESLDDFSRVVEDFNRQPRPVYVDAEVPHMIDVLPPVPFWQETIEGRAERPFY